MWGGLYSTYLAYIIYIENIISESKGTHRVEL